MNIKRYTLDCDYYIDTEDSDQPTFKTSDTGDWVKFEDLQPLLAQLEHLEKQLSLCNLKVIKAREVLS